MKTKELTKDLFWVGNQDPDLKVFDIIMYTEFGTSYNSYVLKGSEKTVLFETSKAKCFDEYLSKVTEITPIEKVDYIIVSHTEPDHTGSIEKILALNPKIKIIGSNTAINFLKEICNRDFAGVPVKDGDTLSLGDKTLKFIAAPNLHWPDTMFTYIEEEKALVTCDAFGAHYATEGITNEHIENQEDYMKAFHYYFDMILSPFKPFLLKAIEKIEPLDFEIICTGHGPVLTKEPRKIVELSKKLATVVNPNLKKTVVIPYVSAYGYTEILAHKIKEGIQEAGDIEVRLFDMVKEKSDLVLEEIGFADGVLFGTPTILGEALKPIWDLTTSMFICIHSGKMASAFGSYGWSGEGVPNIMTRLGQLKMKIYAQGFRVRFKPSEAQLSDAFDFGYGFGASVLAGKVVEVKKKNQQTGWKCLVCGEIVMGEEPPASCPVCGVGPDQFVEVSMEPVTFKSEKAEKFVIIGNGAAGTTACEEIRKRNPVAEIHLISREKVIGYNRPMLTKGILSEIDMLNLFIKPFSWYGENNIKMTLDKNVTEIDTKNKNITLSDGTREQYDKLILATGAESFVPQIKGSDKRGTFTIRHLENINDVRSYIEQGARKAAIIGCGVLGLEAAWELKKAGLEVTLIESSNVIMGRQLDAKGSEFLSIALDKAEINIVKGFPIQEITGGDQVEGVLLEGGTLVAADMVIISTGVRQNVELAKAIGLETKRSILVNEKMETTIPGIYACGDCAEYGGVNYAIWPQAVDMGKVAGANAAGDETIYEPTVPAVNFNGMRTSIFSIGDIGKTEGKKYKTKEFSDEENLVYKKLYFLNGRFCGGILIGDVSEQKELLTAFEEKRTIDKM